MPRYRKDIRSGCVLEYIFFSGSDRLPTKRTEPRPENVRTPEEKEKYNYSQAESRLIHTINTNFEDISDAYYVTLTYDDAHLPQTEKEATKDIDNYLRRLKYLYPNMIYIAVTESRLFENERHHKHRMHHHLIIGGVPKAVILQKWCLGEHEHQSADRLREHNIYNGVDHGRDYTGLACYLLRHSLEHKGKRWKQSANMLPPHSDKPKEAKRSYTSDAPPKAPAGYMFVECRTSDFYASDYIKFKYVRIPAEPTEEALPYYKSNRYKAGYNNNAVIT